MIASILAMILTIFLGVEWGIAGAVIFTLMILLFRMARPRLLVSKLEEVVVARHRQGSSSQTVSTLTEAVSSGIVLVRLEESLLYLNSNYVKRSILENIYRLDSEETPCRVVLFDCSSLNHLDTSGLQVLQDIKLELNPDVDLHFACVKPHVQYHLGKVFMNIQQQARSSSPEELSSDSEEDLRNASSKTLLPHSNIAPHPVLHQRPLESSNRFVHRDVLEAIQSFSKPVDSRIEDDERE